MFLAKDTVELTTEKALMEVLASKLNTAIHMIVLDTYNRRPVPYIDRYTVLHLCTIRDVEFYDLELHCMYRCRALDLQTQSLNMEISLSTVQRILSYPAGLMIHAQYSLVYISYMP